jgi:acyl carrier protein
MMTATATPRSRLVYSAERIEAWVVARLARLLRVGFPAVDPRRTFAQFGLDSLQAARLSGDLEDWLGRELSPSLVYDFPTIESLARHLAATA